MGLDYLRQSHMVVATILIVQVYVHYLLDCCTPAKTNRCQYHLNNCKYTYVG